jgi:hypothetical protein
MKLTKVEQAFDGSKLVFYFTADGRVDFRELVRELAGEFCTRIEMRQIGVRDEEDARRLRTCGRPLCCTTFCRRSSRFRSRWRSSRISASTLEALRTVRAVEVLPALRAAQFQRRRARRLRQRGGCDNPSGRSAAAAGLRSCGHK